MRKGQQQATTNAWQHNASQTSTNVAQPSRRGIIIIISSHAQLCLPIRVAYIQLSSAASFYSDCQLADKLPHYSVLLHMTYATNATNCKVQPGVCVMFAKWQFTVSKQRQSATFPSLSLSSTLFLPLSFSTLIANRTSQVAARPCPPQRLAFVCLKHCHSAQKSTMIYFSPRAPTCFCMFFIING